MSSTKSIRNRKIQESEQNANSSNDKKLNKTPQDSLDTENESPPHKPRSRILKHLESSLSPKYIEFNESTGGQRSRYGREHKYKETDGFLPTEVVYAYQRVGKAIAKSEIKQNTNLIMIKPLGKLSIGEDSYYESPIEKLITKNKKLILGSSAEYSSSSDLFEKTKKRLFTSLTDDSSILLSPPKVLIDASTPNGIMINDKTKFSENISPIPKPIEISTPKKTEVIRKPIRILQKVTNPKIIKSMQAKLALSKQLPLSTELQSKNEDALVNLTTVTPAQPKSTPLKLVTKILKLEKVETPLRPSPKGNITQHEPIENETHLKPQQSIESRIDYLGKQPLVKLSLAKDIEHSIKTPAKRVLKLQQSTDTDEVSGMGKGTNLKDSSVKVSLEKGLSTKTPLKKLLKHKQQIELRTNVVIKESVGRELTVTPNKTQVLKQQQPHKNLPDDLKETVVVKETEVVGKDLLIKDSSIHESLITQPLSVNTPPKKFDSPQRRGIHKLSLKSSEKLTKKIQSPYIIKSTEKSIKKTPKKQLKRENRRGSIGYDLVLFSDLKEGYVLWARLASYPYWPCLVVADDKNLIIQDASIKRVHVKFFADNGRRCWVSLSSVIPYKGLDDFYERKALDEKSQPMLPKKNKQKAVRQLKPYVVPPFQQVKWDSAVKEADEVFAAPIEERIAVFEAILDRNRDMKKQHASMMRRQRKSTLSKRPRSRSPTPECPPFELIGFTPKKIKMESTSSADLATILNIANDIGKDVALSFLMNDTTSLTSPGATTFYDTFEKRFLSNEENLLVNKEHLEDFSKKLWNLKNSNLNNNIIKIEIKDEQLSENSVADDVSGGGIPSLRSSISSGTTSSAPDTNMTEFSKNYLFRKLTREFVCRICFKTKNLLKCEGVCNGWYHKACATISDITTIPNLPVESRNTIRKQLEENNISPLDEFLCSDCTNGLSPACFVCKKYDDENMDHRLKCKNNACGRFYHKRCLKYFPQAKTVDDILICPCHSCHTCISDDPKGKYLSDRSSYVKCVICPASYHMDSTCIPAGTEFITAIQIICPKHREYSKQHNCNWCFICAAGGNLVCCETCPTAFHPECLKIPLDEKGYICEECETGRMPLYGEIVWAKFSRYRWWPAQIIPPPAVPERMNRVTRKKADFCVKFFGSNNYAWINRGRVYLYQEGDWGKTKNNKGIEKQYENALIEAKTMYELLNQQKLMRKDEKKDRFRPLPYVKIKTNKVVPPVRLVEDDINELNPCGCDPKDQDPCGPYSGCLNRLLMFECHPSVCPARERCMNQMFQKRMYPNLQVKRTDLRGWGLVTLENLKVGTFIVEYVGEVIDNEEFRRRVKKMQETKDENYYFLTMIKDLMIDAGPKGNVARFMNHSCEPNCETQKWTVNGITRVGLFAIVDIPANTELTFNYNLECIGNVKKACYCGASKCSGFIGEKSKATQVKKIKRRNSSTTTKKGDRK